MYKAGEGGAAAYYYVVSISLYEELWRRLLREPSKWTFKINSSEFGVDTTKVCNWKIVYKNLTKTIIRGVL